MAISTTAAKYSLRYPSLGDPKPRPGQRVMLVKPDGKHESGTWTDDCKAWAPLHAAERKKVPA